MNKTSHDEALDLLEWLVNGSSCESVYSRTQLCKLLKMQCEMNFSELPLGVLVFVVAESVIRREAVEAARKGKTQVDVLTFDYTAQAAQLRLTADGYATQIATAKSALIQPVAVVSMANECARTVNNLFSSCGCSANVEKLSVVPTCNFDCCEQC